MWVRSVPPGSEMSRDTSYSGPKCPGSEVSGKRLQHMHACTDDCQLSSEEGRRQHALYCRLKDLSSGVPTATLGTDVLRPLSLWVVEQPPSWDLDKRTSALNSLSDISLF